MIDSIGNRGPSQTKIQSVAYRSRLKFGERDSVHAERPKGRGHSDPLKSDSGISTEKDTLPMSGKGEQI